MEGPMKKIKLDDSGQLAGGHEGDSIGSEACANDLVMEEVIRNLPDKAALKKFRFFSRKCSELGLSALVNRKPGCDHLMATLDLKLWLNTKDKEYLKEYGYQFKRVTVDLEPFMTQEGGMTLLRGLLVENLTGMEELEVKLVKEEENWSNMRTYFRKDDTLPHLKSVRVVAWTSDDIAWDALFMALETRKKSEFKRQLKAVSQILEISPQLEEISVPDLELMGVALGTRRWSLVKTLNLETSLSSSTVLAEFAESKPQLLKLKSGTYENDKLCLKDLLALLRSSAESLEELDLKINAQAQADAFRSPNKPQATPFRLVKIKSGTMETIQHLMKLVGPRNVVKALPNLQNVVIHGTPAPHNVAGITNVVFESVNSVVLKRLWSSQTKNLFPNLQRVKIDCCVDGIFEAKTDSIWCLQTTVEVVELSYFHLKSNANHGIDALLTGIPPAVCQNLLKMKKGELQNLNPNVYRKLPSVLNLPRLKSLVFHCVDSNLGPSDLCTVTASHISHIARWGAMDKLPDLRLLFRIPCSIIRLSDFPQVARFLDPVKDVAAVAFHCNRSTGPDDEYTEERGINLFY